MTPFEQSLATLSKRVAGRSISLQADGTLMPCDNMFFRARIDELARKHGVELEPYELVFNQATCGLTLENATDRKRETILLLIEELRDQYKAYLDLGGHRVPELNVPLARAYIKMAESS